MAAESEAMKTYNFLVVGKTGSGKSATGNTMFNREAFESKSKQESVIEYTTLECSNLNDVLVRVVDTPGLKDTKVSEEETLNEIYFAMSLCPEGFNAILFVIPFNVRFTAEENKTLKLLKRTFGDRFIKDFCIVVLTKGETFEDETDGLKLDEWLKAQEDPPEFSELIDDCQNRVVLFYNVGKRFQSEREQSVKKVYQLIKTMPGRYTNQDFAKCAKKREKISVQNRLPAQKQYVQQKLSLIEQSIQETRHIILRIEQEPSKNAIDKLKKKADCKYQELEERINDLIEKMTFDDKGTNVMTELLSEVESYKKTIEESKKATVKEQRRRLAELERQAEKLKNESLSAIYKIFAGTKLGGIGGVIVGGAVAIVGTVTAIYQALTK